MRHAFATAVLLAAHASISAASAHTLSGTVVRANRAPIEGAIVWLSVSRASAAAITDAAGRFSFTGVPTAQVQLIAYHGEFALGGANGQCVSDTAIDIALPPSAAATRLRIVNARFEPIEGARIRRLEIPGVFAVYIEDLVPLGFPAQRSDSEGFLTFPPLPENAFVSVTIGHPAYADGALPALPSDIELDFPLPDGIPAVGRITDAAGNGLDRARISLYQPRELDPPLLATEVLSGPDGFYSAMVPSGKYFVAAHHPKFAMPPPKAILADEIAGRAVADLVMPAGHRLFGRALDAGQAPVPLAVFSYRADNYVVAETVSDKTGRFELLVPAGQGVLHIRAPRRMSTVQYPRIDFTVGDAPEIDLSTIAFRAAPTLAGRVTTRDDTPLDKVLVTSLNLDPPVAVTPNAQGEFTIELETVPDEPLRFRAEHALRFLRRDFDIDPVKLEVPEVRLREFKPEAPAQDTHWANNIKPLVGRPAPDLACRAWFNLAEEQEAIHLADLHGKVVVLMLWASFDGSAPNRQHLAEMNALHTLYADANDVAVISVHDGASTPQTVAQFIRHAGVAFPVGCDVESSETFTRYRTGYVPQVILIDKTGAVRYYMTDGKVLELIKLLRRE